MPKDSCGHRRGSVSKAVEHGHEGLRSAHLSDRLAHPSRSCGRALAKHIHCNPTTRPAVCTTVHSVLGLLDALQLGFDRIQFEYTPLAVVAQSTKQDDRNSIMGPSTQGQVCSANDVVSNSTPTEPNQAK